MILTRCPNCATGYRVTADQLKARGGRVRCGHCRTAFDALESLIDLAVAPAAASSPVPAPTLPVAPQSGDDSPGATAVTETRQADDTPDAPGAAAAPIAPAEECAPVAPESAPDETPSVPADLPATAEREPQWPGRPDAEPAAEAAAEPAAAHDFEPSAERPQGEDAAPGEAPQAAVAPLDALLPPAPGRRSRTVSLMWGVASLLALLALAAQAAYVFRGELAHRLPESRPWLEAACRPLDCRVPLPRFAELVSVEASELHPDSENKRRLLLATTLKNRAAFAQAFPHLEITLTDTRDQAVVRRVFGPGEYLEAGIDIGAGFAANADRVVSLALETSASGATGYRLYVFYP